MTFQRFLLVLEAINAVLFMQSCAVSKKTAFPRMYENPPLSILVLPPENRTTFMDADEYYPITISEQLTSCGYYVCPVEVVSELLKTEGVYGTIDFSTIDPAKFRKFFGADAVLFVTIQQWEKRFGVQGCKISIDMKLVATETGETLWMDNGVSIPELAIINLLTSPQRFFLAWENIFSSLKSETDDDVLSVKTANVQAFVSLPFGIYHQKHLKDGNDRCVHHKTLKTEVHHSHNP